MSTTESPAPACGGENARNGLLGYADVLEAADQETSWERVATWATRARAEGVV